MTLEQIELATRLVAHPRWGWRPGMVYTRSMWGGQRAVIWGIGKRGPLMSCYLTGGDDIAPMGDDECWPELTDGATVGVLLEMLTAVSTEGFQLIYTPWCNDDARWRCGADGSGEHGALTAGEVVALALLEAWGSP